MTAQQAPSIVSVLYNGCFVDLLSSVPQEFGRSEWGWLGSDSAAAGHASALNATGKAPGPETL